MKNLQEEIQRSKKIMGLTEGLQNVVRKDRNEILGSFENYKSWIPYLEVVLAPEFDVDLYDDNLNVSGLPSVWFNFNIKIKNYHIYDDLYFFISVSEDNNEEINISFVNNGHEITNREIKLTNGWIDYMKNWMLDKVNTYNKQ